MKRTLFLAALMTIAAFSLDAQEQRRQAVVTGRGGSPKCTIEVEVDGVADVEIRGTSGRLHTVSGSMAVWRRFECNEPMPVNPANLRFRGIDGRGRQTLIGDPGVAGAAVVRIEDPKSGKEGYTFDLEWNGSAPGEAIGYPPSSGQTQYPSDDRTGRRRRDGDRFESRDAVQDCGQAAEDNLRRNGYSDTRIVNGNIDDQPGHNDWVSGSISGRRGQYVETFNFACSVDMQSRRIGPVSVRPANDGYYGREGVKNRFNRDQALRACGDAVQQRLRADGYRDFRMGNMDLDDRPGDNDWVVGNLAARRGGYSDNFEFSCSIDFDEGKVRSINVNRR